MSPLLQYSDVSLGTAQRVLTAMVLGKDVIAEALAFSRNPAMVVVNKCLTYFGFEDYYASPEQAKTTFAMDMIKAFSAAKNNDGKIWQSFVIKDARDNERYCQLRGTADGVQFIEIVNGGGLAEHLVVAEQTDDVPMRDDSRFGDSCITIFNYDDTQWNTIQEYAGKAQQEIEAGEKSFDGPMSEQKVLMPSYRRKIADNVLNDFNGNADNYPTQVLNAARYIASEIASSSAAPPQNFSRIVEGIINNNSSYDKKLVICMAVHILHHAKSYDAKFINTAFELIVANVELIFSNKELLKLSDEKIVAKYISDYLPGIVTSSLKNCAQLGRCVGFIIQNESLFARNIVNLSDQCLTHILGNKEDYDPISVQIVASHILHVIQEQRPGFAFKPPVIMLASQQVIQLVDSNGMIDKKWDRLIPVISFAASHIVNNHADFSEENKLRAVTYIAGRLFSHSEEIITQAMQINDDAKKIIVEKYTSILLGNELPRAKQFAVSYIVKNAQYFPKDVVEKAVDYIAKDLTCYSIDFIRLTPSIDTRNIIVTQLILNEETNDKKLVAVAASHIVKNSQEFSDAIRSKAVNHITAHLTSYASDIINRAISIDKDQVVVSKIKALILDQTGEKKQVNLAALCIVRNPEYFNADEVNKAGKYIAANLNRYSEKTIQRLAKLNDVQGVDVGELIANKMQTIIKNVQLYDEKLVQFVAAYILNNPGFGDQTTWQARIYIARNLHGFSETTRTLICQQVIAAWKEKKVVAGALGLTQAYYSVAIYDEDFNPDSRTIAINHIAQHLTDYSPQTISHALKMDATQVIANKLKHISLGTTSKSSKLEQCVATVCIMQNRRLFTEGQYNSAIRYVAVIFQTATDKDKQFLRLLAPEIVKMHEQFSPEIVNFAVDFIAENQGHYSNKVIAKAAQQVIRQNRSFFEAPLLDLQNGTKIFGSFYVGKGKVELIQKYSNGLSLVLQLLPTKIFVVTQGQDRNFFASQQDYQSGLDSFYRDKKGQADNVTVKQREEKERIEGRRFTLLSLWTKGDFEMAVSADIRVAKYVLEQRNHEAIGLWKARVVKQGEASPVSNDS